MRRRASAWTRALVLTLMSGASRRAFETAMTDRLSVAAISFSVDMLLRFITREPRVRPWGEVEINVNKKWPGYVTEMYDWYIRPGVNFVGKMENMVSDLAKAFELMKIDIGEDKIRAVPRENESPSHIAKPAWDPALKKETLRLEYAGYVRYGYAVNEALLAAK